MGISWMFGQLNSQHKTTCYYFPGEYYRLYRWSHLGTCRSISLLQLWRLECCIGVSHSELLRVIFPHFWV